MLESALAIVLMWWAYRLSRDIIRAIENHASRFDARDVLDSEYPVFSRKRVIEAYLGSVSAARVLQASEAALLSDPAFKAAANQHRIPEEVAHRMLAVSEEMIEAERSWYRHSLLMDANLNVLAGRQTRDEALAAAEQRLDVLSNDTFGTDAKKLRDEWRARLEDPESPIADPTPRPYTNPWSDFSKQRQFHWMNVGDR